MNVPSDNTELIKIAVELRPKVIKALASKFEHTPQIRNLLGFVGFCL